MKLVPKQLLKVGFLCGAPLGAAPQPVFDPISTLNRNITHNQNQVLAYESDESDRLLVLPLFFSSEFDCSPGPTAICKLQVFNRVNESVFQAIDELQSQLNAAVIYANGLTGLPYLQVAHEFAGPLTEIPGAKPWSQQDLRASQTVPYASIWLRVSAEQSQQLLADYHSDQGLGFFKSQVKIRGRNSFFQLLATKSSDNQNPDHLDQNDLLLDQDLTVDEAKIQLNALVEKALELISSPQSPKAELKEFFKRHLIESVFSPTRLGYVVESLKLSQFFQNLRNSRIYGLDHVENITLELPLRKNGFGPLKIEKE